MDDPFYIDFTQENIGFPVYFSYHGMGKWEPILIANTLEQFKQILVKIKSHETQLPFDLNSLSLSVDLENKFWEEVNETCNEEDE